VSSSRRFSSLMIRSDCCPWVTNRSLMSSCSRQSSSLVAIEYCDSMPIWKNQRPPCKRAERPPTVRDRRQQVEVGKCALLLAQQIFIQMWMKVSNSSSKFPLIQAKAPSTSTTQRRPPRLSTQIVFRPFKSCPSKVGGVTGNMRVKRRKGTEVGIK
jgi:hypothetical protein